MKKPRKPLKPQPKPINPLDRAIGGRLRVFRLRRKLSQAVLGHAVGVTFQQVQKYENGRNRLSGSRLVAFCRLLGCSSEELLDTKSSGVNEDQFGALRDRRTSNSFHRPIETQSAAARCRDLGSDRNDPWLWRNALNPLYLGDVAREAASQIVAGAARTSSNALVAR